MDNPNLGGGEALGLMGNGGGNEPNPWINWDVVNQYGSLLTAAQFAIVAALILITFLIIARIFRIKSVLKQKGLAGELETINALRQRDAFVLQANKTMKAITSLFENSILRSNPANKDFVDYNLKRANVRVLGGYRPMVMEEFYSVIKLSAIVLCALGAAVGLFVNKTIGALIIVVIIWAAATLPMIILRTVVKQKNETIKLNFFDVYCKLHYSLMAGGVTPVNKLLQIYAKTTDDPEMLRFVDNCTNLIETYNEYQATTMIADDYREIAEVGKLMRLIKQQADGADIQSELVGFREEIISEEKYRLSKRVDSDIAKVQKSFILIILLLGQAVLSAMAIYLPDLGLITNFS